MGLLRRVIMARQYTAYKTSYIQQHPATSKNIQLHPVTSYCGVAWSLVKQATNYGQAHFLCVAGVAGQASLATSYK
jgi:hypothetical protein